MKSMKYSSQVSFFNVCFQFGSLSYWSTIPLVGQKASSIRNVKTTDQHLCYWLVACRLWHKAVQWMRVSIFVANKVIYIYKFALFLLDGQNLSISSGSGGFLSISSSSMGDFFSFLAFWVFSGPFKVRIKHKIDTGSSLWGVLNEIHQAIAELSKILQVICLDIGGNVSWVSRTPPP